MGLLAVIVYLDRLITARAQLPGAFVPSLNARERRLRAVAVDSPDSDSSSDTDTDNDTSQSAEPGDFSAD